MAIVKSSDRWADQCESDDEELCADFEINISISSNTNGKSNSQVTIRSGINSNKPGSSNDQNRPDKNKPKLRSSNNSDPKPRNGDSRGKSYQTQAPRNHYNKGTPKHDYQNTRWKANSGGNRPDQNKQKLSKNWKDCGSYYESNCVMLSKEWDEIHRNFTYLGCSNYGPAAGYGKKEDQDKLIEDLIEPYVDLNPDRVKDILSAEDEVRKWYEEKYNVKVVVPGLAVSKSDIRFNGSADGLIGDDGMIEIKRPKEINPLTLSGSLHPYHKAQIHGYLFIYGRKWCDYVVYVNAETTYIRRVFFEQDYWDMLYFRVSYFIEKILKPKLQENNRKISNIRSLIFESN